MADISAEIAAFKNAVYGEEVRSSMVSAIEKINDVAEDAESTVEGFSAGVTQAISNANTAASAANTAASNANTKASAANTAATNANTARTAANNAATAANNAASAATTTNTNITNAESARVSAENARATAEATRQANEQSRQTAETARVNAESARASAESSRASAESQRQSNESTRQGNETIRQTQEGLRVSAESSRVSEFEDMQAAFADMQRQIIPQATESTMGGVIVGDGLNVDNALLSLATTKSGSGTAVASSGAVLESVVVYGQSVQDGTPTPSEPVDIQVVEGRNLFGTPIAGWITGSSSDYLQLSGLGGSAGTLFVAEIPSNTTFIISAKLYTGMNRFRIALFDADPRSGEQFATGHFSQLANINDQATDRTYTFSSGNFTWVVLGLSTSASALNPNAQAQLETGSAATPYVAPGCIGLVVGGAATSIPLQGNVLASLPDGTRDTVTVDGAGHCVLTKNIAQHTFDGSENWGVHASIASWFYVDWLVPDMDYTKGTSGAAGLSETHVCVAYTNVGNLTEGQFSYGIVAATGGHRFVVKETSVTTKEDFKTWIASNNLTFMYPLTTPQTIDLGYIDMPTIPEDATISVSASMTPVIDAAWWERGAEAIANIVKAFSERIKALEEAVAELATA